MKPITRLVNGLYVGATDPAVYAPGSPQAAAQGEARAEQRANWDSLVRDLLAFDAATSSSTLLPRPSVPWTAPATGQQYAARLAKAITLSYETPLGMQVTDCLILAVNYPQAPALELLRSLEAGREHVVAACTRSANPDAAPRIVRGRVVHRMLLLQAQETVAAQARIFFLLALAGLVVAGEDRPLMETLRGCLTQPVLEWEPLQKHPLAHALLDDFLDLQWPADPARALKQAIYQVQGRGRPTTPAPQAPQEPVTKGAPPANEERPALRADDDGVGDDRPILACTGETWAVSWRSRTHTLVGRAGLTDLATLIARPDVPVSAYELAGVPRGEAARGTEILDKRGFAELRRRYEDLEGIQTEAAEQERAALLEELSAANQGVGQVAMLDSGDKRVRQAVTKRIREAIEAIQAVHEELGLHLTASIRTGSAPVYSPAPPSSTDPAPESA